MDSYFGWFSIFETDKGSSFDNRVTWNLMKSFRVKHKFAEARYHQGIGKVERIIGFIQQILRTYNIEFKNRFIDTCNSKLSWTTIVSILPFIMYSINCNRNWVTIYSPAMMMYGDNYRDIPDIKNVCEDLMDDDYTKDDHKYMH